MFKLLIYIFKVLVAFAIPFLIVGWLTDLYLVDLVDSESYWWVPIGLGLVALILFIGWQILRLMGRLQK